MRSLICRMHPAVLCIALVSLWLAPRAVAQEAKTDSTILTYEEDVRFILVRTCFGCHSGKEVRGGLLLDSYDALMEGGENGPPVVPGSPEKSIMYQKLQPNPPFGKMMPRKKDVVLSDYEKEMIRTWIAQGAVRTRVKQGAGK